MRSRPTACATRSSRRANRASGFHSRIVAMKLGFCLLLWDTFITEAHAPIIDDIKATGYDGVEVPMFTGTPADYESLGKRLAAAGLEANTIGVLPKGSCISSDAGE